MGKRPQATGSSRETRSRGGFLRANWPKIAATGSGQATIAGVTGFISYGHVKALTIALGQPEKYACWWPIGVDGMVVSCSVMLLTSKREKWPYWTGLILGIGQSVAGNLASGWSDRSSKLGWPAHLAAASWSAMIAVGFTVSCFGLERWIAGLAADWKKTLDADPAVTPADVPALPVPEALPLPAAVPVHPVPAVSPVPQVSEVVPVPPGLTPDGEPMTSRAMDVPVPVKPRAITPVLRAAQDQAAGGARDCCAAHSAFDSKTRLDREQAPAVWAGHQEAHGRDLGAGALERIFGMGTRPARELRDELKGKAAPAHTRLTDSSRPGSPRLAPAPDPALQARLNPAQPEPATPAHVTRLGPARAVSDPGPAWSGPGPEDGEPYPALAGSGMSS